MSSVRLYGRVSGSSSHAVVTSGFRRTLESRGLLAGVVAHDVPHDEEEPSPPGAQAPHAVFTGPLDYVDQMLINTTHTRRWVVVAPNSDRLPSSVVMRVQRVATDLIAPSRWAADVLRTQFTGAAARPITVVRHGLDPKFGSLRMKRDLRPETWKLGQWKILHFSSSERSRKSTFELVQAWLVLRKEGAIPSTAQLICVLDWEADNALRERLADAEIGLDESVEILQRLELSPQRAAIVLNTVHLVCQPSRAEAFGLVPLEALACGTPVVATACTGHAEYLPASGAVIVPHGELAPSDDHPGAQAPEVTQEEIQEALVTALLHWDKLYIQAQAHAAGVAATWSWDAQLADFCARVSSGG